MFHQLPHEKYQQTAVLGEILIKVESNFSRIRFQKLRFVPCLKELASS